MMVMVAEHTNRDLVSIPQADRTFLMEHEKPPNHWRIWIGAHLNETFPIFTHHVLDFAEEGAEVPRGARSSGQNTHATTICLGQHLLIHAMSSINAKRIVRRWSLPTPVRRALHQIWPVDATSVRWSPDLRLNDAGIELLADDFFEKAKRLLRSRGL
jgi:hypothetical protein